MAQRLEQSPRNAGDICGHDHTLCVGPRKCACSYLNTEKLALHGIDAPMYTQAGSELVHDPCILTEKWIDNLCVYPATSASMAAYWVA